MYPYTKFQFGELQILGVNLPPKNVNDKNFEKNKH